MATDSDNMKVASFEVVPSPGSKSVVVVASGPPHPRPIVLEFALPQLSAITANLIRAMSVLDRDNLIIGLRQILGELTKDVPDAGAISAPSESVGFQWLVQAAAGLQAEGRKASLSDPVIASLLQVALSDDVVLVLSDQEFMRRMANGDLASSRAESLGLAQHPPWTVQLGGGRSLDVDPDLERGEVSVFAATEKGSTQVFSFPPASSYRLGVTLQVASSHVEQHRHASAQDASAVIAEPAAVASQEPGDAGGRTR